jgi:hypothetical protein
MYQPQSFKCQLKYIFYDDIYFSNVNRSLVNHDYVHIYLLFITVPEMFSTHMRPK